MKPSRGVLPGFEPGRFLYSNGQITDLGTLPGDTGSSANGINSSGQDVGSGVRILHAAGSSANGINSSGQVVGESYPSAGSEYGNAFLYNNGQMIDLNTLLPANSGWVLGNANAINDSDQIIGSGNNGGFLLDLNSATPSVPVVTTNPTIQAVKPGGTVTFTATASGTPTPTVQWQVSTDGGKTFNNISGATNTTLALSNVTVSMNGDEYRAVFTNSLGTAETTVTTLTVSDALSASIIDLGVLNGGSESSATGINSSGQVVGVSQLNIVGNGGDRAFLYNNGQMTDLGTLPGYVGSEATGINDSGQVVGDLLSSRGTDHAFLYSNGKMTDLGTLGGTLDSSFAYGINSSGQVVGSSTTSPDSPTDAFLYSNGNMTDLNTLLPANSGWVLDSANAINDSGQIVGNGLFNGQEDAFLYSKGQITNLGTLPGSTGSAPTGINSSGQVVGTSITSYDANDHAFLYSNGQITDLGTPPGDTVSNALGINSSGQVVGGSGPSVDATPHAFLYSNGQMIDLNTLLPVRVCSKRGICVE